MNEETSKLELMRLCDVSRETMDRLEVYSKLLEKWNPAKPAPEPISTRVLA
ncbi:hypothetical protein OAV15_03585 [Amylibacter sp.]|nr:hypothetical protein [Amylibacter sp.]